MQLIFADGANASCRGFNIAVLDPSTGALLEPVRNFDTWATRPTGAEMLAMIDYLSNIPNESIVLLAVGDEAGLNVDNSCTLLSTSWTAAGLAAIEALGSTQIRQYCFRDSWSMVVVKGQAQPLSEVLRTGAEAAASAQVSLI
jgi:hypothetical protein